MSKTEKKTVDSVKDHIMATRVRLKIGGILIFVKFQYKEACFL